MSTLPADIGTVIVGGGVVGMCLARELAIDGADVLVIDDGVQCGSTANAGSLHVQMQSRFMRLYPDLVPNLERSLPLYPRAAKTWASLAQELGADIELKPSGGLMVAESAAHYEFLAKKCAREKELGLSVEMLDRAALDRVAPYLGEAAYGAELCADEGKLNPLLANKAIARDCKARGVIRVASTRVATIERDGSGYRVTWALGDVRCGRLVLAAGAGTGALAKQLGLHVPTVAEPLHMNITEATTPFIGHLVQHADRMITLKQFNSGQVVVGGGWPAKLGEPNGRPSVIADSMLNNLRLAAHIAPRVRDLRVIRAWAGINTTADGQCIIGGVSGSPGLYVSVPGDAGYTLGPLVAKMTAAVIAGRDPGFDVSVFAPERFGRV